MVTTGRDCGLAEWIIWMQFLLHHIKDDDGIFSDRMLMDKNKFSFFLVIQSPIKYSTSFLCFVSFPFLQKEKQIFKFDPFGRPSVTICGDHYIRVNIIHTSALSQNQVKQLRWESSMIHLASQQSRQQLILLLLILKSGDGRTILMTMGRRVDQQNNLYCLSDCWFGRVDLWWLLSCFSSFYRRNFLIHSANPKSRPVRIIVFAHVFKSRKTKQQKTSSLLSWLWVWPSGSLMTPVLSCSSLHFMAIRDCCCWKNKKSCLTITLNRLGKNIGTSTLCHCNESLAALVMTL